MKKAWIFSSPGPKPKKQCSRGKPIECGQTVRFEHTTTSRNLHSHHFGSPLSNAQEVSAFGDEGKFIRGFTKFGIKVSWRLQFLDKLRKAICSYNCLLMIFILLKVFPSDCYLFSLFLRMGKLWWEKVLQIQGLDAENLWPFWLTLGKTFLTLI